METVLKQKENRRERCCDIPAGILSIQIVTRREGFGFSFLVFSTYRLIYYTEITQSEILVE